MVIHLLTRSKNILSALELMRHPGGCYKTAWFFKQKLMELMRVPEKTVANPKGWVEIDDAYLGGKRSGGKVGRGSESKVPFSRWWSFVNETTTWFTANNCLSLWTKVT